ncbi:MAG: hypothetical protein Q8N08_07775 [Methanobacteriaceae archaeon]|nr:hypothetical protein [Methanobacteriaceae archaeon]
MSARFVRVRAILFLKGGKLQIPKLLGFQNYGQNFVKDARELGCWSVKTMNNYKEAYLKLFEDIKSDIDGSSIGIISRTTLKAVLSRMEADIEFLEGEKING